MAINNPYKAYQSNSVTTATPGELTLMLYNGSLKFIKQAGEAIQEKNMQEKNINLQKVQKIINELMITLNMDVPVSKNMMAMYDYMNRRLMEANLRNDLTILSEVEEYMTEFRDTWKEVVQIHRQRQHSQGGRV